MSSHVARCAPRAATLSERIGNVENLSSVTWIDLL
jgi:hypothetical protein